MDLSKISIVARERSPWEAVDLGILLARKWYPALLISWMIPSSLVFLILSFLMPNSPWISITVVWWLKPIWDSFPLLIASRALFGEQVSVKEAWAQSYRTRKSYWIPWLTWRRFSFTRSFTMPVTILEKLSGKIRQQRIKALSLHTSNPATWLTIVCIHLEGIIILGLLGLFYLILPSEVDSVFFDFISATDSMAVEWFYSIVTYLAMVIISPFYTIAGFTLYISRRIELEGWDIEIRFRHLANRLSTEKQKSSASKSGKQATLTSMLVFFCLPVILCGTFTTKVIAEELPATTFSTSSTAQIAKEDINTVLAGEDFHKPIMQKRLRFRNTDELVNDETIPNWLIQFFEFLEKITSDSGNEKSNNMFVHVIKLFAQSLEVVLWISSIIILGWVGYYYRQNLEILANSWIPIKEDSLAKPQTLFGLDVRKDSLPINVPQEVLLLWRSAATREALSLLYRATLTKLMHQHEFTFKKSATENECMTIVKLSGKKELSQYFTQVTYKWQLLAYGHRQPKESDIVHLCEEWNRVFSA